MCHYARVSGLSLAALTDKVRFNLQILYKKSEIQSNLGGCFRHSEAAVKLWIGLSGKVDTGNDCEV